MPASAASRAGSPRPRWACGVVAAHSGCLNVSLAIVLGPCSLVGPAAQGQPCGGQQHSEDS